MTRESFTALRRWLSFRTYVVASTSIIGVLSLAAFTKATARPHFQEIDVERVNIVEPDGKLRMTISDAARSPGWMFHGKVVPGRPKGAGMIFFNDEGEEDGGIGFGGRTVDGKVHADGGIAFDHYESDETVTLRYSQNAGRTQSGLMITDRADVPILTVIDKQDSLRKMPTGAARDSAMKAFVENGGHPLAARRLFAGRDADQSSVVSLSDPQGHPRLRLMVDSTGAASIQFLDPDGHVTKTITALDSPGANR
ncbi:MAG TPA: hypothetical protein VJO52_00635 [Gemmatimonadaceae bacterium]|nr:hypothetical protein [Gemmatimonadaceae bacterium]